MHHEYVRIRECCCGVHRRSGAAPGLQQLIEDHISKNISDDVHIWRGVMAENADSLKLMEVKRTGAGDWIAAVDIIKWNDKGNVGENAGAWSEKHPSREAALEAAIRLAKEHAPEMKTDTSLEARVLSALEWESEA